MPCSDGRENWENTHAEKATILLCRLCKSLGTKTLKDYGIYDWYREHLLIDAQSWDHADKIMAQSELKRIGIATPQRL